jgi:rhamnosyltransferase
MSPAPEPTGQPLHISAVIITFNPDHRRVHEVVQAIAPQVREVLVVDNGSAHLPDELLRGAAGVPIYLLELGDNLGIAAAQNLGLAWAQKRGASHVLLLDHDAVAAPDMAAALLREMRLRQKAGERVAAVGPVIADPRRSRPAPFFRVTPLGLRRVTAPDAGQHSAQVDFLISAGVLIDMAALLEVGMMREDLFIDYVDLEWCMRATARGWRLYGHFGTGIDHRLGEEPLRFLGRRVMAHSPLRHYYMARNALAVWRTPHARWSWIGFDAFALAVRSVLFSTIASERGAHLRMILRGTRDGLRGRLGRQDQAARNWRVAEHLREREPRSLQ